MSRHAFSADDHGDNRLDQAIARGVPGLSRRRARALIAQGSVFVDGARVRVAGRLLKRGARVEVVDDEGIVAAPDVAVLFDGEGIVVVDKPAGLASEPTRQAATSVTDLFARQGRALTAVHRLDVDTTGVLLLAESKEAAAAWSKLFHDQAVERGYLAVVSGVVVADQQLIDAPLLPPHKTGLARVSAQGKAAQTKIVVKKRGAAATLLDVTPLTGRTHQIRAHLAHVGHPLRGDRRYGGDPTQPHLGLHAASLQAVVDGAPRAFTAPPPPAFHELLRRSGLADD
jgi:RluA family pseudouridine synthase